MSLVTNESLDWMGIRVSCDSYSSDEFDIEQIIIDSCLDFKNDHRLCSLIFSWIKIHGNYVVVEKISKLLNKYEEKYFPEIVWIHALAAYAVSLKMHKWKKLERKMNNPVCLFEKRSTSSAIKLKGEISWAKKKIL